MPVPTMMDFEAACHRITQLEDMMSTLQKLVTLQGQQTHQLQQAQQLLQSRGVAGLLGPGGSSSNNEPTSPRNSLGFKLGITGPSADSTRNPSPAGFDDRKAIPPPPSRNFEEVVRQAKLGERDHEDMAMMLEVREL